MIQELVLLSERIRKDEIDKSLVHDALCKERLDAYIYITKTGKYNGIIPTEKGMTVVEDLVRTENAGRTSNVLARLVVDNAKYVLGFPETKRTKECLEAYQIKLRDYQKVTGIKSLLAFYENKKELKAARKDFQSKINTKELKEGTNFGFVIQTKGHRDVVLHKDKSLYEAIKQKYDEKEKALIGANKEKCSCCGSSEYRVRDISTHGTIRSVPNPNSTGNYLVSFEGDVFSSYGLEGNDNSLICTHCAKAYVDALNWLLSTGTKKKTKDGKDYYSYSNRQRISEDTAAVFWLRDSIQSEELGWLDEPPNEGKIREMIKSIESGQATLVEKKKAMIDKFYAITLSGAAARIAVRDWIETSLPNLRANLANWFESVSIGEYNKDGKKIVTQFPRFYSLVSSVKSKSGNDVQYGRIGAALWKCAVLGATPPLWLLSAVLNRIRAEQSAKPDKGKVMSHWEIVLSERIALLKFILNRNNNHKGGTKYMSILDESNKNIAYICGRLFAVLESIQYHASGGNLNAGIRERFFSSASTTPSTAFGRLMKLSQHHLSKIRGEKPGLSVNLDKQLQELMCNVEGSRFPVTFSLEDQASFAIGYYHQRQHDFAK
ncbi:MAG: type I-C CRISPR-associated protein Cas8c/Csd1 [bacterium]